VRAIYAAMRHVVEQARRSEGPAFLLCHTYRYRGHHVGDINRVYYRSKEEEQEWMTTRDPITRLADWVLGQGLTDRAVLERIHADVKDLIDSAVQFAMDAPYPDVSEVDQHVYA